MTRKPRPNYRPAPVDGAYESPKVIRIVEVPGPAQSRQFSEQCVVDVPATGQKLAQISENADPSPTPEHAIYLPLVLKGCTCHAVCTCDAVCACDPQAATPTATISPECLVESWGDWVGSTKRYYDVGNLFYVAAAVQLSKIEFYLDIDGSTELYFFVYEGEAANGNYTRIHQTLISDSGTGERFYNSGPIDVYLASGKHYYIGVCWPQGVGLRFGWSRQEVPLATSFGQLVRGGDPYDPLAYYPPAESIYYSEEYPWSPIYTRLTTCPPGPAPTSTPCSCDSQCTCDGYCSCDPHSCSCDPQTYYYCVCNPQTYYYCVCNPQTYWW